MKEIKILDCTLRDGGYCNDWKFGKRNIKRIITALIEAGISMIEYGYYDEKGEFDEDSTKIPVLDGLPAVSEAEYMIMINFGMVEIDHIPEFDAQVKGMRVAFHKKDMDEALLFCNQLQKKGYPVYVQPMVTNSYTLEEYIILLEKVNELKPAVFYIVDSFGSMYDSEMNMYLQLIEKKLRSDIALGFHGHDNSRLAFDNAKTIIENCNRHTIYIDSSIMGMGRGAGNLSTEILMEYCNRHYNGRFGIQPILKVIDEVINYFYLEKPWGYTLAYYLAARHNCHPNYVTYLDNRKTLAIADMDKIFQGFSDEKKSFFDIDYIENVYRNYMEKGRADNLNENLWKENIENRNILLLAPGKSIAVYEKQINTYIEENHPVIISINFDCDQYPVDYIFFSNIRRYNEWRGKCGSVDICQKVILTSNITTDDYFLKVNYSDLSFEREIISDNAGLMAIRFLCQYNIREIALAGYDGYQYEDELNYVEKEMKLESVGYKKDRLNTCIRAELEKLETAATLHYLTPTKYKEQEVYL